MRPDTKTYWLTDRQSQCDFDFDLLGEVFSMQSMPRLYNEGQLQLEPLVLRQQ
jgi:hypothetical protein